MAGELYLSNLAGNFDYQQILDQMYAVKSIKIQQYQVREQTLQAKVSALGKFNSLLSGFKSAVEPLFDDTIFDTKSVAVSDDSKISASISDETLVDSGTSFDVSVVQLPENDIWLSQSGVSSLDTAVATTGGTLQISYGGSVVATIDYDTDLGTDTPSTLQEIADAINSQQEDVKATVFFDGTNYRLLLSGNSTGADNTISITEIGGGDLLDVLQLGDNYTSSHVQTAQDAIIEIYGAQLTSPNGVFNDVVPGLSITAKDLTTTPVNVSVSNDYSKIKSALSSIVDAYNKIVDFISQNTGKGGVLAGDTTLSTIRSTIFSKLAPLSKFGIFDVDDNTGHISLNSENLDKALNDNFDAIKEAVTVDLKNNLQDYLDYLTGPTGPITSEQNAYNRQIDYIEKQIDFTNEMIKREMESLKKQLIQTQLFMAKMQDVQARLAQTFTSLNTSTQNK
ncbi:flagellar filament capping protein FliD [Desulfurobacterium atlanticum]|uniref:Flagellar hook-associated protein 2 n=1 Tax=Desulfurobacterium atlanticum TaxID=240169 RepID=A0A238ZG74_9BACT|nr:flagellar filament capping protein FliD [Desulfurobacterium atlanticum]SNR81981.1 flagellar hook-associated protein 2 [Desulfurobacterium atlanticum]